MTRRHLRKSHLLTFFGRTAAFVTMAALFLSASVAQSAVPTQLTQQGRLLDEQGAPVTGTVEMRFVIYDAAEDGSILWEQIQTVELSETGYYHVSIGGQDNPINEMVLDGDGRWLAVAVDGGEELSPRFELNTVPYATIAGRADVAAVAEQVADGAIGPDALADDFELPADQLGLIPWDRLDGVPSELDNGDDDTLASLSCAADEITVFDGTDWGCAIPSTQWSNVVNVPAELTDGDDDTLASLGCAATEIATFDGTQWDCAIPSVDWLNIANVPADIADGDDNTDTLAALGCQPDQVATFDGTNWGCASQTVNWSSISGVPTDIADGDDNTDTDTLASLGCSTGQVATFDGSVWGCATASVDWTNLSGIPADLADGDDNTDTLVALGCQTDEIATFDGTTWSCASQSVDWSAISNVPSDIADGDDDTNTDTLAALGCQTGEIVTFDGTSWRCASRDLSWSQLTGVPAGFADGVDDTRSDAEISGAVQGMSIELYNCSFTACIDAPSLARCPAGKVMRGVQISEMHGDQAACGNLDDYRAECCSLRIQ